MTSQQVALAATMKTIAVISVWFAVLAGSVCNAYTLFHFPQAAAPQSNAFMFLALLMPIGICTGLGLWLKGYPFDIPPLRTWANSRFGAGAYERNCRSFKLMALFTIAAFLFGGTLLFRAYRENAAQGDYALAGFFISGAIGFMIFRTLLKRRGLLLE